MKNKIKIVNIAILLILALSLATPASIYAQKRKHQQPAGTPVKSQHEAQDETTGDMDNSKKLPGLAVISRNPYLGAISVDASNGKVHFEDNADAKGYPASIIKLMNMLIILEQVKNRTLSLQDKVKINAVAAKTGGSQVYLKQDEEFTVDELLYALMVQSANDAAVALALHVAGTKEAFVEMMNKKAQELGMTNTQFHSVHGLPPGKDQQPDISTPRDISMLCLALLKYPEILHYTSVKERVFRPDAEKPFIMRNHNHLLGSVDGCDGLKTGYFRAAGFSIAATAAKKGARIVAVVFGSQDRHVREAKTREMLAQGLAELAHSAPPPAAVVQPQPAAAHKQTEDSKLPDKDVVQISMNTLKTIGIVIASCIVLIFLVVLVKGRKKKDFLNDR